MRSLSFFILTLLVLLSQVTRAQYDKKIVGDTLVQAGTKNTYSVDAKFAQIEWKIIPTEAGVVLSHDQNSVTVSWSYHSFSSPLSSSLTALIAYPNADYRYSCFLPVSVVPYIPDTNLKLKAGNLSRTSKDSIRFWYKVLCDTGHYSRALKFRDSSLSRLKGGTVNWHLIGTESRKEITAEGNNIVIRLKPDKYVVNLLREDGSKTKRLSDTLVVLPPPIPELQITNQTPCAGIAATFSTNLKSRESCAYFILEYGDGDFSYLPPTSRQVTHSYPTGVEMTGAFMSSLTAVGQYGCFYKSSRLPISPQKNLFTAGNVTITPANPTLKKPGDKVALKYQAGQGLSLANPNTPFTYLWNTGQKTPEIIVAEPGSFNLIVTDKLGCPSPEIGPVYVRQTYKSPGRPVVSGPVEIKAGEQALFNLTKPKSGFCQFKFIFNNVQSFVTEPSINTSVVLPNWEKSKPGNLKIVGIHVKLDNGYPLSHYSDTLAVEIRAK